MMHTSQNEPKPPPEPRVRTCRFIIHCGAHQRDPPDLTIVRRLRARYASWWATSNRHEAAVIEVFEQPDRAGPPRVKLRIGPMLGFKRFETAAITIARIELLHRIHKGQFNLRRLRLKGRSASAIWNAVLAA